jgi:hypothetical protein
MDPFTEPTPGTTPPPPSVGGDPFAPSPKKTATKSAPPSLSKLVGGAAASTASNVGKALDAQAWLVRRQMTGESDTNKQMTKIRHAIPGMDYVYDKFLAPGQPGGLMPRGAIPALDRISDIGNHAAQGLIDSTIESVLDPLTYETIGYGAAEKALGFPVAKTLMKTVNSTALGRSIYDALNWGGAISRERGTQFVQSLRGQANRAAAHGNRVEQHILQRADQVINGAPIKHSVTGKVTRGVALSKDEKVRVGKALNGELQPTELAPHEQAAYRQLRSLTAMDYRLRRQAATRIAINSYGKSLNPADKNLLEQAFKTGKAPVIPEPQPRVRTPYGDPVPRSRNVPIEEVPNPEAMYKTSTAGMDPATRANFSKALTSDTFFKQLTPALQAQAQAIKDAFHKKLFPYEDEAVELDPAKRYTFQPTNQAEIERMTALNKLYHKIDAIVDQKFPFRENYMPAKHILTKEEKAAGREARVLNPTEYFDPRAQQREDIHVVSDRQLEDGFKAMASNANRQATTKAIHESLGTLLDDPKIQKLFESVIPASGNKRTDLQKLKDGWLWTVGYPRAAIVSFTPRHGSNILDLLANTVNPHELAPVMAKTMNLARKLMTASPKEYAALTKSGRELGALSGNFMERRPFFAKVPVIGKWTQLNNKLVWAIDDAAKQTYAELLVRRGEAEGTQAGGMAAERLIDYANRSPLQNFLRYVAPFGTFRGAVPQAVAGGMGRNLARTAFYNRATGGTAYGGKPQPGQPGYELLLPTAEASRLADYGARGSGLGAYARATIGDPLKAAGGAAQDLFAPESSPKHWAMHGQPWLPQYDISGRKDPGFIADMVLAGIPEFQTIGESQGIGRFPWHGLGPEVGRQVFGVLKITPDQKMQAGIHIRNSLDRMFALPIHDAKASGNDALVQQLQARRTAMEQQAFKRLGQLSGAPAKPPLPVARPAGATVSPPATGDPFAIQSP